MPREELTPDQGLFTDEELALCKRVQKSKVWRLICDTMLLERERLFNGESDTNGLTGQPTSLEALWMNRGAILMIQRLLREGPSLMVYHRRYVEEQSDQLAAKKQKPPAAPEREYNPRPEYNEPPDFDL